MVSQPQASASPVADLLKQHPFDLHPCEELSKHIHGHPELSLHEASTASTVASHAALGAYAVHKSLGGHGAVGVLANGSGPTVLLRADMDALPVEEKTVQLLEELGFATHERCVVLPSIDGVCSLSLFSSTLGVLEAGGAVDNFRWDGLNRDAGCVQVRIAGGVCWKAVAYRRSS